MTLYRVLEALHGHIGFLASAALLHPAILLRRGQQLSRGSRWSLALTTVFAVIAFSMGLVIYEGYRSSVRRVLFTIDRRAGYFFETKEHLAFAVVTLSVGAAACAFLAPPENRQLRRAAAAAYFSATLLALTTCLLGTYVAAVHTFPE
jgi:hypothetical protein